MDLDLVMVAFEYSQYTLVLSCEFKTLAPGQEVKTGLRITGQPNHNPSRTHEETEQQ